MPIAMTGRPKMQKASAAKYATSIDLAREVPPRAVPVCPDPVLGTCNA